MYNGSPLTFATKDHNHICFSEPCPRPLPGHRALSPSSGIALAMVSPDLVAGAVPFLGLSKQNLAFTHSAWLP